MQGKELLNKNGGEEKSVIRLKIPFFYIKGTENNHNMIFIFF